MTGILPCPGCTTTNNNKIIVAEANKKELRIKNSQSKTVHKIIIDNCVIVDTRLRCDYLIEVEKNTKINQAIYLELKGKEVKHAIEQIKSTLIFCKTRHSGIKKECYVICSAVPRGANTYIQIANVEFKNKFNASLKIRENSHEIEI